MRLLELLKKKVHLETNSEDLERNRYFANASLTSLRRARAIIRKYQLWPGEMTRIDYQEVRADYKRAMKWKKESGNVFEEDAKMEREFGNIIELIAEYVDLKKLGRFSFFTF